MTVNDLLRWGLGPFVAALAAGPAPAQAPGRPLQDLDRYVARALAEWRVPGVAVAVVRRDTVVLARGYGVRQSGRAEPVTERTLFQIGSTTKAFSAALLAMLVDEGRATWDDPVQRHLPWFALKDPWVTREVTLRDLLSHRVGVTGIHNALTTWSREEVLRRTRTLEPNIPFRSRYDYSNMMYSAAGEAAAATAGVPWERLLRDRILLPLGMEQTTTDISRFFDSTRFIPCFYCPLPDRPVTLDDVIGGQDVALPHILANDSIRPVPWQSYDNAVSAGSVISNVRDLAEWLRLLLGEGTHRGRRLIEPATFREMLRPQSIITPTGWLDLVQRLSPSTRFWAYGLGWRMNDYRGRTIVWHTGGIIGFLAYVGLVPEEGLGIAVLSNGDLGYELLPPALAYRIIDLHLGPPVRDWSAELAAAYRADRERARRAEAALAAARVAGTRPSVPFAQLAGRYRGEPYGEVQVTADGDRLFFRIPGGARGELVHWHHDVFRLELDATWKGGFFATFQLTPAGALGRLRVDGVGEFERVGS